MNVHFNEVDLSSKELVIYKPKEKSALAKTALSERAYIAYKKSVLENEYVATYKALHIGAKDTFMSKLVRSVLTTCPTHSKAEADCRLSQYDKASQFLSKLADQELLKLLASAKHLGGAMGREIFSLEIEDVLTFVKKIRLSAIEQQNPKSTKNHFDLPTYYQYGVDSAGFGAWREIAAHEMTTTWVLNGECQNFPLLYHYRELPSQAQAAVPAADKLQERQGYIDYWDGSKAIGKRVEALEAATSEVVVFMEHLPTTLHNWLQVKENLSEESLTRVESELKMVVEFMKSKGFLHFDAHLHNILATDHHIYFADFGLATSKEFDLGPDESAFFEKHRDYDRYTVLWRFAVTAVTLGVKEEEFDALLKGYLSHEKIALPKARAQVAERYRPIAYLMHNFFKDLQEKSKSTPYPEQALAREWAKLQ